MKAELLVSTETLAAHLADPDWIVFDTRHDLANTEKGRQRLEGRARPGRVLHAPGRGPLRREDRQRTAAIRCPPVADFAARMNRCGVAPGRQVVVYDDGGGSYAVRLWWMLRWLGHDRVALLDGGFAAWKRENRPLDAAVPAPRAGTVRAEADAAAPPWTRTMSRPSAQTPAVRLLDARAATRFMGEQETLDPVAGHIPGALNRFWQQQPRPRRALPRARGAARGIRRAAGRTPRRRVPCTTAARA